MNRPSVVLVASIDEGKHAHGAQRGRALQRLGCDVTTVNVMERRGPLGLFRSKDLRQRLEQALVQARPDLVLVVVAGLWLASLLFAGSARAGFRRAPVAVAAPAGGAHATLHPEGVGTRIGRVSPPGSRSATSEESTYGSSRSSTALGWSGSWSSRNRSRARAT